MPTWGSRSDLQTAKADDWFAKATQSTEEYLRGLGWQGTQSQDTTPSLDITLPTAEAFHASAPWRDLDPAPEAPRTPATDPTAAPPTSIISATPPAAIGAPARPVAASGAPAAMPTGAPAVPSGPAPQASGPAPEAGGDLHAYARAKAQQYGVDPDIFERQITQESGFNPRAVSPAGARGIAQFMPATAAGVGLADPFEPYSALDAAARHMRQNLDHNGGDYARALAAYNAGQGAVDQYGGVPPFAETQQYIRTIMGGSPAPNAGAAPTAPAAPPPAPAAAASPPASAAAGAPAELHEPGALVTVRDQWGNTFQMSEGDLKKRPGGSSDLTILGPAVMQKASDQDLPDEPTVSPGDQKRARLVAASGRDSEPPLRNRAVAAWPNDLQEWRAQGETGEGTYSDGTPRNAAVAAQANEMTEQANGHIKASPAGRTARDEYPYMQDDESKGPSSYRQPLMATGGPDSSTGQEQTSSYNDPTDTGTLSQPLPGYTPSDAGSGAIGEAPPGRTTGPAESLPSPADDPGGAQFAAQDAYSTPQSGSISSTSDEGRNQEPFTPPPGLQAVYDAGGRFLHWIQGAAQGAADTVNQGLTSARNAAASIDQVDASPTLGAGQDLSDPLAPGAGLDQRYTVSSPVTRALNTPITAPERRPYAPYDPSLPPEENARRQHGGELAQDVGAIPYQAAESVRSTIVDAATSFANAIRAGQEGRPLAAAGNALWAALQVEPHMAGFSVAQRTIDEMLPEARIAGVGPGAMVGLESLIGDGIKGVNALKNAPGRLLSPDNLARADEAVTGAADAVQGIGSRIRGALDANAERVPAPGEMQVGSGVVPRGVPNSRLSTPPPSGTVSPAMEAVTAIKEANLVTPGQMVNLIGDRPEYLADVAQHILDQRRKVVNGEMTARDTAKAYYMTLASQGADAIKVATVEAKVPGFKVPEQFWSAERAADGSPLVRPEEAAAAWLFTPKGQVALNDIERGVMNRDAWREGQLVRTAFGDDRFRTNNVFSERAPVNGRTQFNMDSIQQFTDRFNEMARSGASPQELLNFSRRLNGISEAKGPFLNHALGFGETPTIDAVEISAWLTGQGDVSRLQGKAADLKRQIDLQLKDKRVGQALGERIGQQFEAMRELLPPEATADLPPEVFNHVLHHWIWDRMKGTATTHTGFYDALQNASGVLPSISPGIRNAAYNAAQGGAVGAYGADQQAQQQGREATPGEVLGAGAVGAGLVVAAGNRGARQAVGRALGSGVVPRGPTVEVLQQRLAQARGIVDRVIESGDPKRIAQAQENRAAIESQLVDAQNARRSLEPRIASDVGRRESSIPPNAQTVENRMDAIQPPRDGRMRPEDLSGPVSIPVDNPQMRLGSGVVPAEEPHYDPRLSQEPVLPGFEDQAPRTQPGVRGEPGDAAAQREMRAGGSALPGMERLAADRFAPARDSVPGTSTSEAAQAIAEMKTSHLPPSVASALQAAEQRSQRMADRGIRKPSGWDWLKQAGYAGIYGPATFVNSAVGGAQELALGQPKEAIRALVEGRPVVTRASARAQVGAAVEGLTNLGRVLLGDARGSAAASGGSQGTAGLSELVTGAGPKLAARALERPGEILTEAPDAVFRPLFRAQGMEREASRVAAGAGLPVGQRGAYAQQLIQDAEAVRGGQVASLPATQRVLDAGEKYADELGYKGKPGAFGQWLSAAAKRDDAIGVAASFLVPFPSMASRMTTAAIKSTPGTALIPGVRRMFPSRFDMVYDQAFGAVVASGVAYWAMNGGVTGSGPDDTEKRAQMVSDGWQPNSTLIGGHYIPNRVFGRFQPLLDTAGELHDALAYGKEGRTAPQIADQLVKRGSRIATDQIGLSGLADLHDMWQNGFSSQFPGWAARSVTRYVPYGGVLRAAAASIDPNARKADRWTDGSPLPAIGENLKTAVPGLRQTVPAGQDVLGRPAENPQYGLGAIIPRVTTAKNDPLIRQFQTAGVDISTPSRDLTINLYGPDGKVAQSIPMPLTGDEQRRWNELRGTALQDILKGIQGDPKWAAAPPDAKRAYLQSQLTVANDYATRTVRAALNDAEITRRIAPLRRAS